MTPFLLSVIREIGAFGQKAEPLMPQRPASRRHRVRTDDYVLGERLFKDTLVRERKRADRLAASFAVLVVDRSDQPAAADIWVSIVRSASAVKGDGDVVGWLEKGAVLGMLLPEVSRRGALKVMHRLRREIAGHLGDGALAGLSMRLYAQGVESASSGAVLPPVDLLIDSFVPVRKHPARDAAKRGLDVLGSLMLLALFAPVMAVALLIVKATSPGPVFYKQVRIGRRGEPFTMLKFRTMYVNAGHGIHKDYMEWFIASSGKEPRTGDETFKLVNDPRITFPGRFLRSSSFDELPQFWNVLRGDMSLVGPRPPLPFEVARYQPWHRRRVLEAKPGITGAWQVRGRSRTTFDEMVRMDLEYARTHSLWTDVKILAATPRAMFKGAC
jgi:lipopolysaccharide/colanic/teichoic acid biosynthesis glycosyltransferase